MEQTFPPSKVGNKRRVRGRTRSLVLKARDAALGAVAAYNNPSAAFKSGTYVVLMHVAWTSLLLAILTRRGDKPYYRKPGSNRFERIDGRPKVWELNECVRRVWADRDDPVRQNLRFFIGIRNLVEHGDNPALDMHIFGECQAMLFNFEDLIEREFGDRYSLNATLAMSLQFSRTMNAEAQQALRNQLSLVPRDVRGYIETFRASLSTDVLNDMQYSYKVFLIPMVGNHRSKDALAIEFVNYDPENPDHDRVVALIKPRTVPALNYDLLKAMTVIKTVNARIAPKRLNTNTHAAAYRYWKIRPDPSSCTTKYCIHDPLHHDYLYTPAWVEFLVNELADDETFRLITGPKRPTEGLDRVPSFLSTAPK